MRKYLAFLGDRPALSSLLACVGFSIWSLLLGQDNNWDLRNYHLYNAFAWLNDRVGSDMAPAGMESYFNPLMDLPYYWITRHWSAPAAGLILGAWHGLTFAVLCIIAINVLEQSGYAQPRRLGVALALAGTLTPNFLENMGTSMGDNSVALFSIAALAIIVRSWPRLMTGHATWALAGAGMLAGIACGIKLTNAMYALAFCLSFLFAPLTVVKRLRLVVVFGLAAALGMSLAAGWWWIRLWQTFGNPFFPQFAQWFPNDWSTPVNVADDLGVMRPGLPATQGALRWLPKSAFEYLLWPFVFSIHGRRLGDFTAHPLLWPVTYLLFIALGVVYLKRRGAARQLSPDVRPLSPVAIYMLAFMAIAYVLWMRLFSIYRYTGPIEVLMPLAIWMLLHRLLSQSLARTVAIWTLCLTLFLSNVISQKSWGHEPWAKEAFRVDVPSVQQTGTATVLIMSQPVAWILPWFPKPLAAAAVNANFPADVGYWKDLSALLDKRGGEIYAIVGGDKSWRADKLLRVQKFNAFMETLGATDHAYICDRMKSLVGKVSSQATVVDVAAGASKGERCAVALKPEVDSGEQADIARQLKEANQALNQIGLRLDGATCKTYDAYMGQGYFPYQWCQVARL
ncbi:hypothetical protein [Caballeronia sp. J97]|uniref:hypothetical protein n=1 Tax=Caballeronia sp. J97 TaxID=2805429 RepID=UPI002AAF7D5E|nr:hypothetical protein [Caballeronia sp. J97]